MFFSDLILHILADVLDAYEMQVNKMKMKIIADPSSVMIEQVRNKLNSRYMRIQKLHKSAPESDHKKARSSVLQFF